MIYGYADNAIMNDGVSTVYTVYEVCTVIVCLFGGDCGEYELRGDRMKGERGRTRP